MVGPRCMRLGFGFRAGLGGEMELRGRGGGGGETGAPGESAGRLPSAHGDAPVQDENPKAWGSLALAALCPE